MGKILAVILLYCFTAISFLAAFLFSAALEADAENHRLSLQEAIANTISYNPLALFFICLALAFGILGWLLLGKLEESHGE